MKRALIGLGVLLALTLPSSAQNDATATSIISKLTDAGAYLQTGGKGTTQAQAGAGLLDMFEQSSANAAASKASLDASVEALDNSTASLVLALMDLQNAKNQRNAITQAMTAAAIVSGGEMTSPTQNNVAFVAWLKMMSAADRRVAAAEAAAARAANDWKTALAKAESKGYKVDRGSLDDGEQGGDGNGVMNPGANMGTSNGAGCAPTNNSGSCAPGCMP